MKLVNFRSPVDDAPMMGVVLDDDRILPIREVFVAENGRDESFLRDTLAFVQHLAVAKPAIEALLDRLPPDKLQTKCLLRSELQLLPSVLRPLSLRDTIGFEQHVVNCVNQYLREKSSFLGAINSLSLRLRRKPIGGIPTDIKSLPYHYFANLNSIVGDGAIVTMPAGETHMDFELELGVVIGKKGKNIAVDDAHSYIAGYTIFNDYSARDIQFDYTKCRIGPGKGKSFDGGNVLGPYFVTADEVDDVYSLGMRAWVNGEQWTDSSMSSMTLRFDRMISILSRDETLYPGDIIGSGTTPNGSGMELGRYLRSGDVVELEIDGLGRQTTQLA